MSVDGSLGKIVLVENMATARKRQDEKHLKTLRELAALPPNKKCFDCHQRGPTYVNMTIGSFVCTSCSGILRGLTPPHRVKSISMASFTPEEIDTIKARGNEYCQRVWLGTYDDRGNLQPDSKDEQRIRDFMIAKYEKKKYFVSPGVAMKYTPVSSLATTPTGSVASTPDTKVTAPPASSAFPNLVQLSLSSPQRSVAPVSTTAAATTTKSVDFLADLRTNNDAFGSVNSSSVQQASFANFDNNPIFSSTSPATFAPPSQTSLAPKQTLAPTGPAPVKEDRYAALKDLDSIFNSKPVQTSEPNQWGGTGTSSAPLTSNGGTSASPWQTSSAWNTAQCATSSAFPTRFGSPPSSSSSANAWSTLATPSRNAFFPPANNAPAFSAANPFTVSNGQIPNGVGGFPANSTASPWSVGSNQTGLFPSSQSMNFPPTKAWQTSANPFLTTPSANSSNPFL